LQRLGIVGTGGRGFPSAGKFAAASKVFGESGMLDGLGVTQGTLSRLAVERRPDPSTAVDEFFCAHKVFQWLRAGEMSAKRRPGRHDLAGAGEGSRIDRDRHDDFGCNGRDEPTAGCA